VREVRAAKDDFVRALHEQRLYLLSHDPLGLSAGRLAALDQGHELVSHRRDHAHAGREAFLGVAVVTSAERSGGGQHRHNSRPGLRRSRLERRLHADKRNVRMRRAQMAYCRRRRRVAGDDYHLAVLCEEAPYAVL